MTDTKKTDSADQKAQKSGEKTSSDATDTTSAEAETDEVGGPKGLEPTRYGDWERKGILSDF